MSDRRKRPARFTVFDWFGITDAPNWRVVRWLGPLVFILLSALFLLGLAAAVAVLVRTITGNILISLGSGAVIVAILGAPFLIWGTVIRQKTLDIAQEGHMTDRISKAVEQLGAEKTVKEQGAGNAVTVERSVPNIEVRIGAILSLERIAQDSTRLDKGRDHVRVMEILCAYIRENAPASGARDFPLPDWEPLPDDASAEDRQAHLDWRKTRFADLRDSNAREWAQSLPGPREDIAQALKVIGRRTPEQLQVEARWGPEAAAEAAWVFDTPCPSLPDEPGEAPLGVDELKAYNDRLDAWKTLLRDYAGYRPDLRATDLQGADLSDLTLSGALLGKARMEGANLNWSRMEGAVVRRTRMAGAFLHEARMQGAILYEARMEGARLTGARMEGANLYEARMEGAVLTGTRMDKSTSLSDAEFAGSALREADCTRVPISPKQVNAAFGDASVILPDTIPRPAHWPGWELPQAGEHGFHAEWRRWQADPEGYTPPPNPA